MASETFPPAARDLAAARPSAGFADLAATRPPGRGPSAVRPFGPAAVRLPAVLGPVAVRLPAVLGPVAVRPPAVLGPVAFRPADRPSGRDLAGAPPSAALHATQYYSPAVHVRRAFHALGSIA